MSDIRRVFIVVKTYPTLSEKYDELVCTAGILDDGSWARIYPLPFRKLTYKDRYKKYQWMEVPLERNMDDPRPESYKVANMSEVNLIGEPVGTERKWAERKEIIFKNNPVYTELQELITKANSNELSIAIFKPTKIIDFIVAKAEREWDKEKLNDLKSKASQTDLFKTKGEVERDFSIVKKLPYKFSYKLKDSVGRQSTLMIEDWEIGALYWNCLKRAEGDETTAVELVRKKYMEELASKDIHLFLGTTRQFHGWAKNPFVIIGLFYPPIEPQASLF